jgi:hypothetical protein
MICYLTFLDFISLSLSLSLSVCSLICCTACKYNCVLESAFMTKYKAKILILAPYERSKNPHDEIKGSILTPRGEQLLKGLPYQRLLQKSLDSWQID